MSHESEVSTYSQPNPNRFLEPTSIERRHMAPKPVDDLTEACLKQFTPKGIAMFVNGEQPKSPRDPATRDEFDAAVRMVVSRRTEGLIDENGNITAGREQEWRNVAEITPQLVGILTSRNNRILAVSEPHAAGIVGFAIDAARDPRVIEETVINVGFGGSDDAFTNTRLASYGEPAALIAQNMADFYRRRFEKAQQEAQFERAVGSHGGHNALNGEEKKRLRQQIRDGELPEFSLSESEKAEVQAASAVPSRLPTLRYFFADQAAIAINHTKDPEAIDLRTRENMQTLYDHITGKYPDVAPFVQIVRDEPWDSHTRHAELTIDALAAVVEEGEEKDPRIKAAVEHLRGRGESHGGENGHKEAHRYAGYHAVIFQDVLNMPQVPFLREVTRESGFAEYGKRITRRPLYNIVIGGRTEKEFDVVRQFVSSNASPHDLVGVLQRQIRAETDSVRKQELIAESKQLSKLITLWQKRVNGIAAAKYTKQTTAFDVVAPDRPYQTISLITDVGRHATYYALDGLDMPIGADPEEQLTALRATLREIEESDLPGDQKNNQKDIIEGVIFDLRVALSDNPSRI